MQRFTNKGQQYGVGVAPRDISPGGASDGQAMRYRNGLWVPESIGEVPVGGVVYNPTTDEWDGYAECNGQALSRTTESALFAVIGTSFGSGDGSTTYNTPNYSSSPLVGTTAPADALDAYVKLLIRGDSDFSDEKGHTTTPGGSLAIDTARYKFGGGSMWAGVSNDYLRVTDHADWDFGTGDFCIDCWVYFNSHDSGASHWKGLWCPQTDYTGVLWGVQNGYLTLWISSTGGSWDVFNNVVGSSQMSLGIWHHVAVSRSGNTFRMFIDGLEDWTSTSSVNISHGGYAALFQFQSQTYTFDGNIDHFRVTKGVARYTSTFTPESSAIGSWMIKL